MWSFHSVLFLQRYATFCLFFSLITFVCDDPVLEVLRNTMKTETAEAKKKKLALWKKESVSSFVIHFVSN